MIRDRILASTTLAAGATTVTITGHLFANDGKAKVYVDFPSSLGLTSTVDVKSGTRSLVRGEILASPHQYVQATAAAMARHTGPIEIDLGGGRSGATEVSFEFAFEAASAGGEVVRVITSEG